MEVIRIENLSKLYDLGQVGTGTITKDLNRWWARVRGNEDPYAIIGHVNDRARKAGKDETVWALKDINFSVQQGEVLGIIGRNGAGKSTLLKIISRITTPSTGSVKVRGRIASLLEVGTGFHPEMTGRENIFMNGSILGMRRWEIQKKFDEIVDFAGVEAYIDTPVKRYSSGMYVRLAFAVAAFLEPEILIVDEVLAVGDAEFQKKCLGRMKDVSVNDGRTVLFVSHNMNAVKTLCRQVILLKNGTVETMGDSDKIIDGYLNAESHSVVKRSWQPHEAPGDDIARLCSARLIGMNNEEIDYIDFYTGAKIEITYRILKEGYNSIPNFHFFHNDQAIFVISEETTTSPSDTGLFKSVLILPPHFLNDGIFSVGIAVTSYPLQVINFYENPCLVFEVIEDDLAKRKHHYRGPYPGVLRPELNWKTEKIVG